MIHSVISCTQNYSDRSPEKQKIEEGEYDALHHPEEDKNTSRKIRFLFHSFQYTTVHQMAKHQISKRNASRKKKK